MTFKRTLHLLATAMGCFVLSSGVWGMNMKPVSYVDDASLELSTYLPDQIEPLLPELQEWVERAFIQYPYLWVAPADEYYVPNVAMILEKDAMVALVRKNGRIVGVAAGVSLDSLSFQEQLGRAVMRQFKERGFDPSVMVYMCYFLTAPEYLNEQHLVDLIYNQFVDFAHSIGKTQLCYLEDSGNFDHPLKPQMPMAIEPWGHVIHGFKNMNVEVEYTWPTMQSDGSVRDQAHAIEFFVKDLNYSSCAKAVTAFCNCHRGVLVPQHAFLQIAVARFENP